MQVTEEVLKVDKWFRNGFCTKYLASHLKPEERVGKVDPKLYRSISLDSYDFTTLSEDYMGKIYFQV